MKTLLVRLLIVGGLVGGGIYAAQQKHISLPLASKLEKPAENMQSAFQDISENVGAQTQQLSERTKKVSEHVQNVLGETTIVEENKPESDTAQSSEKPIHEKTIEYGQYLYCQQVIKDYEATQE